MSQERKRNFISRHEYEVEEHPTGTHEWLSRPGLTDAEQLVLVRVRMPPGRGHQFHRHPALEEIIYVESGQAEQWVGQQCRLLGPGEMAHIPADVVHGTYNAGEEPLVFLAILSPAVYEGPFAVDVFMDEPWRILREPLPDPVHAAT